MVRASVIGLPVSRLSHSAMFSRFCSISSAMRSRYLARSSVGVRDHAGNAALAAATAAFTSRSSESASSPHGSPVAGSMLGIVAPLAAGTRQPSMKFCAWIMKAIAELIPCRILQRHAAWELQETDT